MEITITLRSNDFLENVKQKRREPLPPHTRRVSPEQPNVGHELGRRREKRPARGYESFLPSDSVAPKPR